MGTHQAGRTGRTRVRTKRQEPSLAEPTTIDEFVVSAACCQPVTLATFRNEALVRLQRRHMGRTCAGALDHLDVKAWREEKGLR